jgi:hypothetical protein
MRSRLEAKWAILFDIVGWEWDYEPLDLCPGDGPGRIPDYLMRFAHPTLIECKPAVTIEEIAEYRTALLSVATDWLCADLELELRKLDAAPGEDLSRTDELLNTIGAIRDYGVVPVHGRKAFVVGSQLFIDRERDLCTIDGSHAFVQCGNHVGLQWYGAPWPLPCLVCDQITNTIPVASADMLSAWRAAGRKSQWNPPA